MVRKSGRCADLQHLAIDVAAMGMLIPRCRPLRGFVDGDFGRAAQMAGLFAALSAV